mmetsp:Transcript_16237/g.46369  ORF Transcript_16237/g.46369 Transcript_16237/m.46369 type:complete len:145 (+) Transcript_16237:111-545(+)
MSTLADLLNAGRRESALAPAKLEAARSAPAAPTMSSQDLQMARELAAQQAEVLQDEPKVVSEKESSRLKALEAAKNMVEARILSKKPGSGRERDDGARDRDRDRDRERDRDRGNYSSSRSHGDGRRDRSRRRSRSRSRSRARRR